MVVVMANGVFHGFVSELIGLTVDAARFESATGDPHAKAVGVVIPSYDVARSVVLNDGQTPHFAAPVDDGGIEQSARFQVHHKRCGAAVDVFASGGQARDDGFVVVPRLVRGEQLDEAHSALDQPSCEKATRPKLSGGRIVESVQPFGGLGFRADVEGLFGGGLQARSEGVALNPCVEV